MKTFDLEYKVQLSNCYAFAVCLHKIKRQMDPKYFFHLMKHICIPQLETIQALCVCVFAHVCARASPSNIHTL